MKISQQQKRQRLAVKVEVEGAVHAAFKGVIDDEIERRQVRQLVARHGTRALVGKQGQYPLLGHLLQKNAEGSRQVGHNGNVGTVALVAGAAVGNGVKWNRDHRHGDTSSARQWASIFSLSTRTEDVATW